MKKKKALDHMLVQSVVKLFMDKFMWSKPDPTFIHKQPSNVYSFLALVNIYSTW